jgi:cytochrome P450
MQTLDDLPFLDIKGAAYAADPDAVLARLRDRHWIARSARGLEVLSYDKCEQVLSDPNWVPGIGEILAAKGGVEISTRLRGLNLLTSEGDDHTRLRRAVQPWFSTRRVGELRERTRRLISGLLDKVAGAATCDFHSDIAIKIPSAVFCWMVGADETDAAQIASWSGSAIKAFNDIPEELAEINAALNALGGYVLDLVERKRGEPAEDLISHILAAVNDGTIHAEEVTSVVLEMLAASSDNTSHSASIIVSLLCRHPDQWRALTRDRSLIANAVEEGMRYLPRVRCGMHLNPAEVDLGGLSFPARTRFYLHIASANRDPTVYEDPDRFDVKRIFPRPQLVFGVGRHFCLGSSLARMELQEVLRAVLEKWRDVAFDGEPDFRVLEDVSVVRMPLSFRAN